MQDTNAIPHSVGQVVYTIIVLLSGGTAGGVLLHFLNRRWLGIESEARAAKTKAEARHLDSETIDKAYERIDELHAIIDELRAEREKDRLELLRMSHLEYFSEQQKKQLEQQRIELDLADQQMKKLKGFIDAKGLKPSDLDEPKS
ncbi:MAG TPA: hypothetical protein VF290_18095 [Pyrinomonadaceae bacterium]